MTQCGDGLDNDGNGLTDYPADQGCSTLGDATEAGYTPPPTPPPGVQVYKTASKRDFLSRVYIDQAANGGLQETAAHGYPTYPTSQVSPTGTRICSLYDPTSFITQWTLGGFDSPSGDYMAAWNPSTGRWYRGSANSFGNSRYNWLTCVTNATPDTSLTATGNGVTSSSEITVEEGTPVTLTWLSQYGQIRQGSFTAVNFTLTTTIAGHWRSYSDMTCTPGNDDGVDQTTVNIAQAGRSLMALPSGCFMDSGTVWVPDSTASRPYGGSQVVTPTETTTYTYRGTNANGTNSSSVTVNVTPSDGLAECEDTLDNDDDGLIDFAGFGDAERDPDCSSAEDTAELAGAVNECTDEIDNDGDGAFNFDDEGCDDDADGDGDGSEGTDSSGLSCSPSSSSAGLAEEVTFTATPDLGPYTWEAIGTGATCEDGTDNTEVCSFSATGPQQVRVTADGETRTCSPSVSVVEACSPASVIITASPDRVKRGGTTTIHWEASEGCSCTVTGSDGFSSNENSGDYEVEVNGQILFTNSCSGTTKNVRVNIAPDFIEF